MRAAGEIANNPLNIRTGNDWRGELPVEKMTPEQHRYFLRGFEAFEAPEYGIRAGAIILRNYARRYGVQTVSGIISRWAPPSDNNPTAAYIAKVATALGVDPDAPIDTTDPQILLPMIESMIDMEIGRQPYPDHILWSGIRMADGKEPTMEPKPKHPLASKTLWVNVIAGIAAVGTAFGLDLGLDPEQQTAIVGGILALVNLVLRFVTKQPIGGGK